MNVEHDELVMMWFSNVLGAIVVETQIVGSEQAAYDEASLFEGGRTG